MVCSVGYYAYQGSTSRTCQSNGNWTGSDLICSLVPPTFYNQTVAVYEVIPLMCARCVCPACLDCVCVSESERNCW